MRRLRDTQEYLNSRKFWRKFVPGRLFRIYGKCKPLLTVELRHSGIVVQFFGQHTSGMPSGYSLSGLAKACRSGMHRLLRYDPGATDQASWMLGDVVFLHGKEYVVVRLCGSNGDPGVLELHPPEDIRNDPAQAGLLRGYRMASFGLVSDPLRRWISPFTLMDHLVEYTVGIDMAGPKSSSQHIDIAQARKAF